MNIYFITQTDFNINLDIATWMEMSRELGKKGCNVELIIPQFDSLPEIDQENVKYVFLPYPRVRFLASLIFQVSLFFYSLKSVLFRRCDLFLVDPLTVPTLIPFALLKTTGFIKPKFVLDVRSVPVDTYGFEGKIQQLRFGLSVYLAKYFFDGITVITELYSNKFAQDFNIQKEDMGVWTSGVSVERFNPDIKSSVRKKLNLEGKFVLMYHGGISESRGINYLIDAMEKLKKELPDTVLLLVGRESGDKIRKSIEEKELLENVVYTGAVNYDEIPEYISACDIGILPFPDSIWWRMSSPLKLFEYFAMGKPVILTDIESHRLFADEIRSVFLIDSNSPENIADGIKKVHNNKEKLSRVGIEGIELVMRKGTWKVQAEEFIKYANRI